MRNYNAEDLYEIGNNALKDAPNSEYGRPHATVLLTSNKKIYVAINDFTGKIAEQMKEDNETEVAVVASLFKDGNFEMLCHGMRCKLLEMNAKNVYTKIPLEGIVLKDLKTLCGK